MVLLFQYMKDVISLKKIRNRFERFCFKHKNWGIPNLMLYITIANALVYLFCMFSKDYTLYYALCFDRALILQGQVWRLFTYIFTSVFSYGNIIFVVLGLICYFSLGRAIEHIWGTLRFNLFYFTGVILMDIYCMIFGGYADSTFLNLSLFLSYATLFPDHHFVLFFIIPIKAWILGVIDLALLLLQVVTNSFPYNLFPIIALANYFLFFGKDVCNIFPLSWRVNASRLFRKKKTAQKTTGTVPLAGSYRAEHATVKAPYTHRCTVCGKTDVSNPELEFRYCSRCNGYFCYCQDHISNHTHVE